MAGHQGRRWADLPDGLLHTIVSLSTSFSDLLAFAATCRSWRAAVSSSSSNPTFSTLLPPLLLQPHIPPPSPPPLHHPPFRRHHSRRRPCHVIDPANQISSRLFCHIPLIDLSRVKNPPLSALAGFCFRGASYGNLIVSSNRSCLLVDVFTCVTVSPPLLPGSEYTEVSYGALTAPPASPAGSHLLVTTRDGPFFWRVGSQSWLRPSSNNCNRMKIRQIVAFNGRVFGIGDGDSDSGRRRLFTLQHSAPDRIHIQEMAVLWGEMIMSRRQDRLANLCLVVCGDMLLLVGCRGSTFPARGDTFEAFRLDASGVPATWVKVERLENWAVFISTDQRSQSLSVMNPERWGGRSNCVYCYSHDSEDWTAFELGKPLLQRDNSDPSIYVFISHGSMLQPMWIVPSTISEG